jgi:hypothetical protein
MRPRSVRRFEVPLTAYSCFLRRAGVQAVLRDSGTDSLLSRRGQSGEECRDEHQSPRACATPLAEIPPLLVRTGEHPVADITPHGARQASAV